MAYRIPEIKVSRTAYVAPPGKVIYIIAWLRHGNTSNNLHINFPPSPKQQ